MSGSSGRSPPACKLDRLRRKIVVLEVGGLNPAGSEVAQISKELLAVDRFCQLADRSCMRINQDVDPRRARFGVRLRQLSSGTLPFWSIGVRKLQLPTDVPKWRRCQANRSTNSKPSGLQLLC